MIRSNILLRFPWYLVPEWYKITQTFTESRYPVQYVGYTIEARKPEHSQIGAPESDFAILISLSNRGKARKPEHVSVEYIICVFPILCHLVHIIVAIYPLFTRHSLKIDYTILCGLHPFLLSYKLGNWGIFEDAKVPRFSNFTVVQLWENPVDHHPSSDLNVVYFFSSSKNWNFITKKFVIIIW